MIYPYRCNCGKEFEVIKSSKIIDRVEKCPHCGHNCTKENRFISRTHFYGASDWDNAEWNPAFGKVIRNKKHRDAEAKRLGLEEVGNTDLSKYHKGLDDDRAKKLDDSYEKAAKEAGEYLSA